MTDRAQPEPGFGVGEHGPPVIAPMRVDTVTLTDATDFAALVLDVLGGAGGYGSTRSDTYPVDWVFRAYSEVRETPYADRMARGVAACLTAADPLIRAQALVFFQAQPGAAGHERIVDLAAGDRALFAGIVDPIHSDVDLEWQLLAALAAQLTSTDPLAAFHTPTSTSQ